MSTNPRLRIVKSDKMTTENGYCLGAKEKHRICMVSDFFYPKTGGVESHIFQLSQCLIRNGHKVVMITHAYGDRSGVRYMTNGLKVYYLPFKTFYNQCVFPTLFVTAPLIRSVLIRENITIVHGHSAFSVLALESLIHAHNLGLKTVFTDHSLFGFADASAIITNKLLQLCLLDCDSVICVSHVGKENTVLRAKIQPQIVHVIPNAVDSSMFTPSTSRQKIADRITIIVMSRLVYRKGIDLLVELIPQMCVKHAEVYFIIGGDGPMKIDLEEMIERHELYSRVKLLGAVPHDNVRCVLNDGQIFLNTSLTEAYCMAIVEAASCGLQVVTTDVGGVPEVLPSTWEEGPGKLAWLSKPNVDDLINALELAISNMRDGRTVDRQIAHEWVRDTYNWMSVTELTEQVYDSIAHTEQKTLAERLCRCLKGPMGHKVHGALIALGYLVMKLMDFLIPAHKIDRAPNFCLTK